MIASFVLTNNLTKEITNVCALTPRLKRLFSIVCAERANPKEVLHWLSG